MLAASVEAEPREKIEVEYLPDNLTVSRINGTGSPTVTDWLWRKVGLGGLALTLFLSPWAAIIYREVYPKPEK